MEGAKTRGISPNFEGEGIFREYRSESGGPFRLPLKLRGLEPEGEVEKTVYYHGRLSYTGLRK